MAVYDISISNTLSLVQSGGDPVTSIQDSLDDSLVLTDEFVVTTAGLLHFEHTVNLTSTFTATKVTPLSDQLDLSHAFTVQKILNISFTHTLNLQQAIPFYSLYDAVRFQFHPFGDTGG